MNSNQSKYLKREETTTSPTGPRHSLQKRERKCKGYLLSKEIKTQNTTLKKSEEWMAR